MREGGRPGAVEVERRLEATAASDGVSIAPIWDCERWWDERVKRCGPRMRGEERRRASWASIRARVSGEGPCEVCEERWGDRTDFRIDAAAAAFPMSVRSARVCSSLRSAAT